MKYFCFIFLPIFHYSFALAEAQEIYPIKITQYMEQTITFKFQEQAFEAAINFDFPIPVLPINSKEAECEEFCAFCVESRCLLDIGTLGNFTVYVAELKLKNKNGLWISNKVNYIQSEELLQTANHSAIFSISTEFQAYDEVTICYDDGPYSFISFGWQPFPSEPLIWTRALRNLINITTDNFLDQGNSSNYMYFMEKKILMNPYMIEVNFNRPILLPDEVYEQLIPSLEEHGYQDYDYPIRRYQNGEFEATYPNLFFIFENSHSVEIEGRNLVWTYQDLKSNLTQEYLTVARNPFSDVFNIGYPFNMQRVFLFTQYQIASSQMNQCQAYFQLDDYRIESYFLYTSLALIPLATFLVYLKSKDVVHKSTTKEQPSVPYLSQLELQGI